MPLPEKDTIFKTLNKTCHRSHQNIQLDLFSPLPSADEYWLYSDLANLFGPYYIPNDSIRHTKSRLLMPSSTSKPNTFPDLVPATPDFYNQHISTHNTKHPTTNDLKLTRYACWCLTLQHPALIFSRTYFISPIISPHISAMQTKNISYQFARVHLRKKLSHYEKIMGAMLHNLHANFHKFNQEMTETLFNGYSCKYIKERYNIKSKPNDPISNYMGAATLNIRTTALHNTIKYFDLHPLQDIDTLSKKLSDEIITQRLYISRRLNIHPEYDIFTTPVKHIETQLRKTELDFISRFSKQK